MGLKELVSFAFKKSTTSLDLTLVTSTVRWKSICLENILSSTLSLTTLNVTIRLTLKFFLDPFSKEKKKMQHVLKCLLFNMKPTVHREKGDRSLGDQVVYNAYFRSIPRFLKYFLGFCG